MAAVVNVNPNKTNFLTALSEVTNSTLGQYRIYTLIIRLIDLGEQLQSKAVFFLSSKTIEVMTKTSGMLKEACAVGVLAKIPGTIRDLKDAAEAAKKWVVIQKSAELAGDCLNFIKLLQVIKVIELSVFVASVLTPVSIIMTAVVDIVDIGVFTNAYIINTTGNMHNGVNAAKARNKAIIDMIRKVIALATIIVSIGFLTGIALVPHVVFVGMIIGSTALGLISQIYNEMTPNANMAREFKSYLDEHAISWGTRLEVQLPAAGA